MPLSRNHEAGGQFDACLCVCEMQGMLFGNVFSSLLAQHPVGRGRTVFLKAMKNI